MDGQRREVPTCIPRGVVGVTSSKDRAPVEAAESRHLGTEECDPQHAVVIVTWRRPAFVRTCLQSLYAGDKVPEQVIVVDASEGAETQLIAASFPGTRYVRFPGGAGHMTTARNEGLRHVSAAIVSFIDDDVQVDPNWSAALKRRFTEPGIAAVAGRVRNGDPGERDSSSDRIGRLLPDGTLTGFFAADPGAVVPVDHGIGANMSFRRIWLARLGGFRDVFPGTAMREDTDIFLRLRTLGGHVVFDPSAVVDNYSAPHVKGRRFDIRYAFYAERNHLHMLGMNYGLKSPQLWRYVAAFAAGLGDADPDRRKISRVVRGVVRVSGLAVGLYAAVRSKCWRALPPERSDRVGKQLRLHLSVSTP
jgi:GT2 family glycosyltransferase